MKPFALFVLLACLGWTACQSPAPPTSSGNLTNKYDEDTRQSVLLPSDTQAKPEFVRARLVLTEKALQQANPVLLCQDSLNSRQQLAQLIALYDTSFTKLIRQPGSGKPYRCEIFGVYPARQSDMTRAGKNYQLQNCFRVEMYNYALNRTSVAITDIVQQKVLTGYYQEDAQPDIPLSLKNLAVRIAVSNPEVQAAYGIRPDESDALMASTKTALNRTRCERSGHLCVAPTFVKDGKALWAIVDLTDYRVSGIRWTNVGSTGPAAPLTEKKLQDDKVTACFCEQESRLEKDGWKMDYMLTSSDGLRISAVSFNGAPVLQSAKLVDWHVNYSGTDGFGYSDAVGCPYFSQAAVVAYETPKVAVLRENGIIAGFVLEQTFRSEQWPGPCNYNYVQRYEFYKDGRFRVAAASLGRGCGNDGTYRPVFRIAFAGANNHIAGWDGKEWQNWNQEQWQLQDALLKYTPEGYAWKLADPVENGYYIEPGRGQFGDGGRGDNAYVYATLNKPNVEEGESDLVTIGPCCNTDFHQGPEKFIYPNPESISNSKIVFWYVAQLKNDNTKGREYCWAESVLENGVYVTHSYPCFCGPMFVPLKK
jgi:hypothetical protein